MSAVPDPRFRDQLAEVMPEHQSWCHAVAHGDCCGADDCDCGVTEALDRIAAHVEARVQAEVRERAAEELREAARDLAEVPGNPYPLVIIEFLDSRATFLAQPADGAT